MKLAVSNRTWILLSTAIVIGVAFSYYFLVYVKGKEQDLVEKNFRVLQQVVQNIGSLNESFFKNAESIAINEGTKDSLGRTDSNQKLVRATIADVQQEKIDSTESIQFGDKGIFFNVTKNDSIKIYFTEYTNFFDNPLFQRRDVFDRIIISKVIVSGDEHRRIDRQILYSNSPIAVMDSVFHQAKFREAKDEIKLNDQQYLSFNQKVTQKDDTTGIFISGLVKKDAFEKKKRGVSPVVIFFLTTALILIILSMPILKLKIMSMEERLHIKDVVFNIFSMLIGPALFIVFLYTVQIFFGEESDQLRENLSLLSGKIEKNFQKEVSQIVWQIDTLNNFSEELDQQSVNYQKDSITLEMLKGVALSDFLQVQPVDTGVRKFENKGYLAYQEIDEARFDYYKHPKDAFWLTREGKVMVYLTLFTDPALPYDLRHRKYVMNIVNKDPSFFNDVNDKRHEIGIESIKSVMDGSYEVGIGKATDEDFLPVLAISTKASSVMGTILDEGYGFCILDKDGKTIFHSDIMNNMNENFLQETDGVFAEAIVSNTVTLRTVNYLGLDQKVYFRPLNCLSDHYIATFANNQLQYGAFTLSMISSFSLFLSYLCIFFIFYLIMYATSFRPTKLRQVVFIFFFIRPYETSACQAVYKKITKISYLVGIYLILSMALHLRHSDFIISELILMVLLLLISSFYALSSSIYEQKLIAEGLRKPVQRVYAFVVLAIIGLMFSRIFYFVSKLRLDEVWLLALVLIVMLVVFFYILRMLIRAFRAGFVKYMDAKKWIILLIAVAAYAMMLWFVSNKVSILDAIALLFNVALGLLVAGYVVGKLVLENDFRRVDAFIDEISKAMHRALSFLKMIPSNEDDKNPFHRDYLHYLMLWVVLFSIIPINLFVQITYQKEDQIFAKFRGLQLSKAATRWQGDTKNEFGNRFVHGAESDGYNKYVKSIEDDTLNFALVDSETISNVETHSYDAEDYSEVADSILVWKNDTIPYKISEFKFDASTPSKVTRTKDVVVTVDGLDSATYQDTTYWWGIEQQRSRKRSNAPITKIDTTIRAEFTITKSLKYLTIENDSLILLKRDLASLAERADKKAKRTVIDTALSSLSDTIKVNTADVRSISFALDTAKNLIFYRDKTLIDIGLDRVMFIGKSLSTTGGDSSILNIQKIGQDSLLVKFPVSYTMGDTSMTNQYDTIPFGRKNIVAYYKQAAELNKDGSISIVLIVDDKEKKRQFIDRHVYTTYFDSAYRRVIRPRYNERTAITRGFVENNASDNSWKFKVGDENNVIEVRSALGIEGSPAYILIEKSDFFDEHEWLTVIVSILTIILFYNLLQFNLTKVYGFGYKAYAGKSQRNKVLTTIDKFIPDKPTDSKNSFNNIFMVGVNSAHSSYVESLITLRKPSFLVLDFYDLGDKVRLQLHEMMEKSEEPDKTEEPVDPDNTEQTEEDVKSHTSQFEMNWHSIINDIEGWKSNDPEKSLQEKYVLIDHFEFAYNDIAVNKQKLFILKYLLSCDIYKVLVKSEINATKLLEFYHEEIKRLNELIKTAGAEQKDALQKEMNELRIDYKKWQHLLGSFVKVVTPIQPNWESKTNQDIVDKELSHGEFLEMIRPYVEEASDLPNEDKILTIQQMSYPYYYSIWNSLSKEERYLAYDIAKDRFVNTVNTNAINSLLDKGILVYDHSLRLMNESFTNFVLTTVSSDEALEMEMISRKKGNWSTAFGVILLLIISIVIFISFGQQNFLNEINAFLTGIAALVGLLIRFSGFLSFGRKGAVSEE